MIDALKYFCTYVVDIFYPSYCTFCKVFLEKHTDALCAHCLSLIQPVVSVPLKITESYMVSVFAVGAYQDPLKKLVMAKHYRNKNAAQELGILMWEYSDIKNLDFDCIIPIPLHWKRYAYRWYNQAASISDSISEKSGKPVVHGLIRKYKTSFQWQLSRIDRSENVKHVFEGTDLLKKYQGKHILLVDDVLTTGATVIAAIKTLRRLGAEKITVAVACRVI